MHPRPHLACQLRQQLQRLFFEDREQFCVHRIDGVEVVFDVDVRVAQWRGARQSLRQLGQGLELHEARGLERQRREQLGEVGLSPQRGGA